MSAAVAICSTVRFSKPRSVARRRVASAISWRVRSLFRSRSPSVTPAVSLTRSDGTGMPLRVPWIQASVAHCDRRHCLSYWQTVPLPVGWNPVGGLTYSPALSSADPSKERWMSSNLSRLGRFCARHPWRTIGAWVLVALVIGMLAASAKGYSESFKIPGTESQQATDLLEERFPAQAGATAQVVLHSTDGALTDPTNAAAIDAALARVEQLPGVTAVVSPTETGANGLSTGGDIGYAVVNYDKQGNEIKSADLDRLEAAMKPAAEAGLQVEYGGEVARAGERP